MRLVMTSQDDSWEEAAYEMKTLADAGVEKWLARGTGVFSTPGDFTHASRSVREGGAVFVRHLFPLEYEALVDDFETVIKSVSARMKPCAYSVQTRIIKQGGQGGSVGSRHELTNRASAYFQSAGFTPDVANPAQIISVLVCGDKVYAGLSAPEDNLSAWPGGERRFMNSEARISRAEFKLLEAAEAFGLRFDDYAEALDLGGSPGGWSRVLLDRGLKVVCVDPADVSPKLNNPKLRHMKTTAQEFLRANEKKFQIILNDMRMDAMQSAMLTVEYKRFLCGGGFMLTTLKLAEKGKRKAADKALAYLRANFTETRARQLFHNRSEITAVMYP